MCNCGNIQELCTCQESAQPYCEQCSEDNTCAQIMDSACVIYHSEDSDPASKLINTNLPNKTPIEKVVEELDKKLSSQNIPITEVDTDTVDLTATGAAKHTISANVKISADADNVLSKHADGLYVPSPVPSPFTKEDLLVLLADADIKAAICAIMTECMGACPGIVDIT